MQEIRKYLSQVEGWKKRRAEIEEELNEVWTDDGELEPPLYPEGKNYKSGKETEGEDNREIIEVEGIDSDEDTVRGPGKIVGELDDEPDQDDVKSLQSSTTNDIGNENQDEKSGKE